MERTSRTGWRSFFKKANIQAKVLPVAGPIILPIVFGMCLTSLNVIGKRVVENFISVGSTEIVSTLDSSSGWGMISIAMFIGAFLFSLPMFIASLLRKTPYAHFRLLFTVSAGLIAATNGICSQTNGFYAIFAARLLMGVGTGIACALGPVYYIQLLGPKTGSVVASIQGLFITLGVFLEGRISEALRVSGISSSYIFAVIFFLAFVSFALNILYTVNLGDTRRETGDIEIIRAVNSGVPSEKESVDAYPYLMIGACMAVHIVQQMTGINPILSNQSIIFTNDLSSKSGIAKAFFDSAGFIGCLISIGLLMIRNDFLPWMALLTGIAASGSLFLIYMSSSLASCWGAGMYLLFFSIGLANLPWMLPSILLTKERNVSMAAGLGSLANSVISCCILLKYTDLFKVIGRSVFGLFSVFALVEGFLGFYLLQYKTRKASNTKERRIVSQSAGKTNEMAERVSML